jgi:hypothetical protein
MKPKTIISILHILTMCVYYISALATVLLISLWVYYIAKGESGIGDAPGAPMHTVTAFNKANSSANATYAADSTLAYYPVQNQYKLKVSTIAPLGYYSIFIFVLFAAIGLSMLKAFMEIFKEIKLDRPFTNKIIMLLKRLAILFFAADTLNIIHYFIFSRFMHHLFPVQKFSLNIEIGSYYITGLIIWIIAVIYQRGVELQTEHDLTV